MPRQNLRDQSLDDLLARVQGLTTVGSDDQVRSIMAVFARCTTEISDRARQLSEDLNQAKKILGERLTELTAQINASTAQASADMQGAKQAVVPVLAEFVSELKRTRLSISEASSTASKGTDALVRWTKTLVFATIVYVLITGGLLTVSLMQLRLAAGLSTAPPSQPPVAPGQSAPAGPGDASRGVRR